MDKQNKIQIPEVESRELVSEGIEIRENDSGGKTVSGYAVKWEKKSETMGYFYRFKEQFKKGAFAESLAQDDQRALWSHDTSKVLGRTKNTTLKLSEDDVGLRFDMDLPDTTLGSDAYKSVKRGDIDGVSFGFKKIVDEWDESDPDNVVRTISKAKLFEISLVAFPAYPDSTVSARSYEPYQEYLETKKTEERSFFVANQIKKLELKKKECGI